MHKYRQAAKRAAWYTEQDDTNPNYNPFRKVRTRTKDPTSADGENGLRPPCPYTALNIPKDATLATIRNAHRKLVLCCHPDRVQHELASAEQLRQKEEQFYQVQQAYEILSNENRRQRYDENVKLAKLKAEMVERRESSSPYEHRSRRTESTSKFEHETRKPAWSRYDVPNIFAATYAEARPSTSRKYTDERYTTSAKKTSLFGRMQEERKAAGAYEDGEDYRIRRRETREMETREREAQQAAIRSRLFSWQEQRAMQMGTKSRGKFVAPATPQPATVANPFASSDSEASPRYTPSANTVAASTDNPYAFLSTFDTVFLIDDSDSMAGRSWRETSKAIAAMAPICTAHDKDGIDIYFLNAGGLVGSANGATVAAMAGIGSRERITSSHHDNPTRSPDSEHSTPDIPLSLQVPSSPSRSLGGSTLRSRSDSFNSEADTARSRATSVNSTTETAKSRKNSDVQAIRSWFEGDYLSPEEALKPDKTDEKNDAAVNSPFAFSPGQLNKILNPKSLAAYRALGGLRGLERGLTNKRPAQPATIAKPFTPSSPEASPRYTPSATLIKLKQGLLGSANGVNIAAMADTGSRENIISESYAKDLGLNVEGSPSSFKIGNARRIQSLGTVSLLWAFAENPKESFSILCHVLPRCTYSLILGNRFLKATETMSKFGHRLTKCLFSIVNNVSHFGFLGESCQRLEGTLADEHQIFAIPDTGADRNVMSLQYAIEHGLEVKLEPENRGYLQFADGTYDKTVGQVETFWTFQSGERIPITFEILRDCCSDVIIGEDILTEHNVFQAHASSIFSDMAFEDDPFELAPFDFFNSWQRGCERLVEIVNSKKNPSCQNAPPMDAIVEERRRRSVWNHEYDFGASATTGEKELELARRERFTSNQYSGELPNDNTQITSSNSSHQRWERSTPEQRMPVVPSIPTSHFRQ